MEIAFYFFSILSIFSVFNVIFQKRPIYSLLYLIIFFLSITGIFFSIKLYSIGIIGSIVQTGAVSVLFLFVIMILNKENNVYEKYTFFEIIFMNRIAIFIFFVFFLELSSFIYEKNDQFLSLKETEIKNIGFFLFSKYVLILELISILLLSSLIISCHYMRKKL